MDTTTATSSFAEIAESLDASARERIRRARTEGDLRVAHECLRAHCADNAEDPVLWTLLGSLCLQERDAESAIRCFHEAIKGDPGNGDALEQLVRTYVAVEQYPQAALLATQWTKSSPDCVQAWISLARLHLLAGNIVAARDALGRALAIEPRNVAARQALTALDEAPASQSSDAPGAVSREMPLPFLSPLKAKAAVSSRANPPILWVGPALTLSSYGIHTRQSILWLRGAGASVEALNVGLSTDAYIRAMEAAELRELKAALSHHVRDGVFVMHHAPATVDDPDCYRHFRWRRPDQLAYAAFTTFETEGLPASWVAPLNRMDEVWVYSDFNARMFAEGGVDSSKLRVIGAGVDTDLFDPRKVPPTPRPTDRSFMFLSVFQWHSRKGWPILVEAFARTFSRQDDVCLVIRSSNVRGESRRIDDQINACLAARGMRRDQVAPIVVLDRDMNDADMRSLYRAADAFVLPTRGEGWGIPFHEAMSMALPVIGTRWSGHLQFMNDANSYLLDVRRLVEADEEMLRFNAEYAGLRYAEPDMDHLMHLMRHVVENRAEAREIGLRARADICRDWSRTAYIERLRAASRDLAARAEGRRPASVPAQPARNDILPVVVHGPAFDPCGYAHDFRNLLLGLRRSGVDVRLDHQTWNARHGLVNAAECAELAGMMNPDVPTGPHISIENSLVPPSSPDPRAYRIIRTFWETDRYPLLSAEQIAGADEIWVACSHNADALIRSGVPRGKLHIVPVALDASRYAPGATPLEWADPTRFTFLSCFDVSLRKGWDLLLKAFLQEFTPEDDVGLLLNLHSSMGADRAYLAAHVDRWARKFARPEWLNEQGNWRCDVSPVRCIPRELHGDEMPSLYQSGDAYVLASRGEGWAIPAMEAMASGLPVIATAWGGHMDYMNDSNAFLTPFRMVPVSTDACREAANFAGQMWAEADPSELRKQMRFVRENSDAALARGMAGRETVLRKYNRATVNEAVLTRLRAISARGLAPSVPKAPRQGKRLVVWEGCQLFRSSLALVNRELVRHLDETGDYALHLLPSEPQRDSAVCHPRLARRLEKLADGRRDMECDVYVRHGWPPDFTRPAHARKFVMIQPWEFGHAPDAWVPALNSQVDELWVPSRHVFETYVSSGVNPDKVWVVPNGVDLDTFKPEGPRMDLPTGKTFRFLFVGGTIWRKGIDVLLKAWCAGFRRSDDVCLVIKDMGSNTFYRGQCAEEVIRGLEKRDDAPEVVYLTEDLSDSQMAALYRSCDCLVLPYRGEGFGLPVAEAGACGLPVIVSQGGATNDFVPPDAGFFIECRRVPFQMKGEHAVNGWLLEPGVESLARQMRFVVANADERDRRRRAFCGHVRRHLGWGQAAKAAQMRLRAILMEPGT